MRSLPLPPFSFPQVLALCLSGTTDAAMRAKLIAVQATLMSTGALYDANARLERLDLMSRVASVGSMTKDELVDLYSKHLSATKGSARAIYDYLRTSTPSKKCPLCGVGTVAVVDHHLPKRKYPDLSVVPANLVPACQFCNDTKKARFPKNPGEQTLHPYYDARLLTTRWVVASIHQGPPVSLVFAAAPPSTWSLVDQQRVKRHFAICGLGIVFSSNANDDLSTLKPLLEALHLSGGDPGIQAYLLELAGRYATRPNCWQLSMYEALAKDAWFIAGGFKSIA